MLVEELGHRAHPPGNDGRCLLDVLGQIGRAVGDADLAQLVHHVAHHVGDRPQAFVFLGEGLDQAPDVVVPALRHLELEVGEDEGVESLRIELGELEPVLQAEPAEDAGDLTGPDPADVVQADVELPLVLAAEGLAAAAGHVVLLEDQHPLADRREVCRGGETGEAGADHDHIWIRRNPGNHPLPDFVTHRLPPLYTQKSDYSIC